MFRHFFRKGEWTFGSVNGVAEVSQLEAEVSMIIDQQIMDWLTAQAKAPLVCGWIWACATPLPTSHSGYSKGIEKMVTNVLRRGWKDASSKINSIVYQ